MNSLLDSSILLVVSILLLNCVADEAVPSKFVKNYSITHSEGNSIVDYLSWEHEDGALQPQNIQPIKVVESISNENQSIYFANLFCIISTSDGYLFTNDAGNLVVSDKDFVLKKIIGKRGDGPGEFAQPVSSFITADGNIWTHGTSNRGFAVHSMDGQLLNNFTSKAELYSPSTTNFLVKDSKVYYSLIHSEYPITVLDDEGTPVKEFGEPINKFAKEGKEFEKFGYFLPYDQTSFLFIGACGPVIQRYTYDGELLETHNWVGHPHFESFFKGTEIRAKRDSKYNMMYMLFQNVAIANDKSVFALTYYIRCGRESFL